MSLLIIFYLGGNFNDKKIITLLIVGVMTISVLSGCICTNTSTEPENENKTGTYELFWTKNSNNQLKFLNEFNEEKYEIIDISHDYYYWYVTYKIKE